MSSYDKKYGCCLGCAGLMLAGVMVFQVLMGLATMKPGSKITFGKIIEMLSRNDGPFVVFAFMLGLVAMIWGILIFFKKDEKEEGN